MNTNEDFEALRANHEVLKVEYEDLKGKAKNCRQALFRKQKHNYALQKQIIGLSHKPVDAPPEPPTKAPTAQELLDGMSKHQISDN